MCIRDSTRTAPEEESVYIFSGFLRCGDCGQNMVKRSTTKNGKRYYYYHCSTYKNGDGCSSHLISEKTVHKVVLDAIQRQIALLVNAENTVSYTHLDVYKRQAQSRQLEINLYKKKMIHSQRAEKNQFFRHSGNVR